MSVLAGHFYRQAEEERDHAMRFVKYLVDAGGKGGKQHRVESCDLHTLGHGGILLGGGDRETLTPCGHVADNNHVHHYALAKKIWSPGISVGANDAGYACGCTVTHNLIYDSPHAAVLYGGNDHRIEFNEVHDFLIESDDLGGFYTNNGWTSYGNDLGFTDPSKLDFRMSPDAAVFKKVPGFTAIPFEKIGLYVNELRLTLPSHPSGHSVSQWHQP